MLIENQRYIQFTNPEAGEEDGEDRGWEGGGRLKVSNDEVVKGLLMMVRM